MTEEPEYIFVKGEGWRPSTKYQEIYVHKDGSRWSVEWVSEKEWPHTRDHRGWHVLSAKVIPDKHELLLKEQLDATRGVSWMWIEGPGCGLEFGGYVGPQAHPGFVFRRLP